MVVVRALFTVGGVWPTLYKVPESFLLRLTADEASFRLRILPVRPEHVLPYALVILVRLIFDALVHAILYYMPLGGRPYRVEKSLEIHDDSCLNFLKRSLLCTVRTGHPLAVWLILREIRRRCPFSLILVFVTYSLRVLI